MVKWVESKYAIIANGAKIRGFCCSKAAKFIWHTFPRCHCHGYLYCDYRTGTCEIRNPGQKRAGSS